MSDRKIFWCVGFVLFLCASNLMAMSVWFVDWECTATLKDGKSWDTAFSIIQDGVDAAFVAGGGEVWVAEGTYKHIPVGYMAEVIMKEGVHLYGGFKGIGGGGYETLREQRNWNNHKTIISGNFNKRCVNGASNATLDGFCLGEGRSRNDSAGGYSYGGGIGCWNAKYFIIRNCHLTDNLARGANGMNEYPVYPYDPWPTPGGNGYGGGLYLGNSQVHVINSIIEKCQAIGGNGGNGLILFGAKGGDAYGGAVYADSASTVSLMNCVICSNRTIAGKGGVIGGLDGIAQAGGLFLSDASLAKNSIIYWNGDNPIRPANVAITYCDVDGGFFGEGNISADPIFVNSMADDFRLKYNSPCIDAGTTVPVSMDMDGNPRPFDVPGVGADGTGSEFDMGAFEFYFVEIRKPEMVNHVLGRYILPDQCKNDADRNGDGIIDVADIVTDVMQK